MTETDVLAQAFQSQRARLRSVAYRMLGSLAEADDAVQETWLKASRSGAEGVDNLGAWLTTVVSRVCLDQLRARRARREESLEIHVPDPVIAELDVVDPEAEALMADTVGLALLVVLEQLTPAERVAFVLHDFFDLPFGEIAAILGRSPVATRQLASRARRRVSAGARVGETDVGRQRAVVDAFLAASRGGSFEELAAVLAPDVVLRVDLGPGHPTRAVVGREAVARQALMFSHHAPHTRAALVNGALGIITTPDGRLFSVMGITVVAGRVAEMTILADPERIARLELRSAGGSA
ncbi:MAG TPA: sigma-70 family RNA polymerase sigma factor [Actinomycetota bacterium]|nr:sigma-70 family RNA polymerase sigma factor [Actinomycetota bacterium]